LEKDRARRYETPVAFAGDISRYLANDPVEARPPTTVYRVGKFVRRHKWGATVAAAGVAVLVLIAVGSILAAREFQKQEQEQRQLALEKEQQRDVAVRAEARADEEAQSAVTARRQAVMNLADAYTAKGLDAANVNGLAALWFAKAAVTAAEDPERVRTNMIRVNNWLMGRWIPVAAVGKPGISCDQLTFNPENSRYLMTYRRRGKTDAPPQIWDLATEQQLHMPAGYDPPSDAVWAAGGQVLLGNAAGHVALASMPDLKILREWDAGGTVKRVAFRADGRVVAATRGKSLLAWTVSGEANPAIVEHPEEIVYVGFSTNGDYLVTATDDEAKARVFAVGADNRAPTVLRQTLGPVTHIYRGSAEVVGNYYTRPPVFVDRGTVLLTVDDLGLPGQQATIKWYDTASGTPLATTTYTTLYDPRGIAVSPDGGTVALGHLLFNVSTKQLVQSVTNSYDQTFSPNGELFANSDATIQVYRTAQGKAMNRAFPTLNRKGCSAFSNDGKYMAVLSGGVVQVMSIPHDPRMASVSRITRNDGHALGMAFSHDGQYVMPIGNTGRVTEVRTLQVRETATGKSAGKALPLDADLVSADFSPDGQLVAVLTGSHQDKRQLRIWNWQKGSLVCPPFSLDSEPVWVSFAPDGKAVAAHCMNGSDFLIDPATGGELLRVQCRTIRLPAGSYEMRLGHGSIGFSHDGRTFYTWGSRVVQAWDRATGHERFSVTHSLDCWACAESPDGRILATAGYDGCLRMSDTANGRELRPPIEHPSQILTVAFSPDGRLIGTTCLDWQARVWEVSTGKVAFAMAPVNWASDLHFTPDSRFTITGMLHNIQLWESKTGLAVTAPIGTGASGFLDIARNGNWAVSGSAENFTVVDLQTITAVPKSSPEEALLWTELLSCSRIDGSNVVNLTNVEWLERWQKYRRQHPEYRPLEDHKLP
jgi:WD40 repeat protein